MSVDLEPIQVLKELKLFKTASQSSDKKWRRLQLKLTTDIVHIEKSCPLTATLTICRYRAGVRVSILQRSHRSSYGYGYGLE